MRVGNVAECVGVRTCSAQTVCEYLGIRVGVHDLTGAGQRHPAPDVRAEELLLCRDGTQVDELLDQRVV